MAEGRFGRFQIQEELGQGGMAKVFRAYDPRSQNEVAVKTLPPEFQNDLGVRARFEWERQLVLSLEHEAIVPVNESGEFEGQPYLVMPFMPGGSLAARLLHGPLAPEEAAAVLERIGRALDYSHARGVIHRDIKPSNILFDKDGKACLADFGIAWQESSVWEPSRAISGTPVYMSPEQVLREEIDPRSDIYALGIIAFEMLSGRPPFEAESPLAVALKQVYDPLPPLQTTQVPASLEAVVQRALAKDAGDRYPNATTFTQAFRSALKTDQKPGRRRARSQRTEETKKTGLEATPSPASSPPPASPPLSTIPYLPPLREYHLGRPSRRGAVPWTGWKGQHILAMLLAAWLGLLLASAVAAAGVAGPWVTSPKADFEIVYDAAGAAVINTSGGPLDLTELAFQRLSDAGEVSAAFPALQWARSGLGPVNALQASACFQLLVPGTAAPSLVPGRAPDRPEGCQVSQGWLLAQNADWLFWVTQDRSQEFQVLYGQRVIQTCPLSAGRCLFSLPGPE